MSHQKPETRNSIFDVLIAFTSFCNYRTYGYARIRKGASIFAGKSAEKWS